MYLKVLGGNPMVSNQLIARICDDVGRIYQLSCDRTAEETIASPLFKTTASIIREELTDATDAEIFAQILQIYSEVIRQH